MQTLAMVTAQFDWAMDLPGLIALLAVIVFVLGCFYDDRLPRTKESEIAHLSGSILAAEKGGDYATALNYIVKLEELDPSLTESTASQAAIGNLFVKTGAMRAAADRFRRAWTLNSSDATADVELIDGFCTEALRHGAKEAYPELEKLIRQLTEANPDLATLKGTLGGILFELGREAEAQPLLQSLNDSSDSPMDVGICAAYLSAIAAKHGDSAQAASYRDRALDHLPDDPVVRRVLGMA